MLLDTMSIDTSSPAPVRAAARHHERAALPPGHRHRGRRHSGHPKALGIEVPPQILRLQATPWWSWSDSNQPPKCYGTWFESDQLPWSDTHPDRRAFVVFRDYPGSWSDSNEQPDF